jgi:DNA-binding transcriptional ArsR family regulator
MKTESNIAHIAALVGDPARANILTALLGGQALTASELAQEGGVSLQTASSHLAKLREARLIGMRKQGRHRYYNLGGSDVARMLEAIMGVAAGAGVGPARVRPGPKEPVLRRARVCYGHLAGDMGVRLYDGIRRMKLIASDGEAIALTRMGRKFCADFAIDVAALERLRRPVCRDCLDWSERRSHLAGSLGTAFLNRFYDLGWARRETGSRVVTFGKKGEKAFLDRFAA